jgi:hypothetical protein
MTDVLIRRFTCDSCGMVVETSTDHETRRECVERLKWREQWVGGEIAGHYEHTCASCLKNESTPEVPAGYSIHERVTGGQHRYSVINPAGGAIRKLFPTRESALEFCRKDAAKIVTQAGGMRVVTPGDGVVTREMTAHSRPSDDITRNTETP